MRRFFLVDEEKPDQTIGEGVVWSNGFVSVRWYESHLGWSSTIESTTVATETMFTPLKLLWVDPYYAAPHPIQRSVNGGPFEDAVQLPSHCLLDGWGEPNGVTIQGAPLHVGQQVRLLEGGFEGCGDVGEITSFTINDQGKLRICLAGVNCCNMADVDLAEIEPIETKVEQTRERYGGRKPSWGWHPTIMIPPAEGDSK